ncbi:YciI family protein [Sphingomonas psychrotolerans]|uniref:YciI family protein n=1 Tax=Sphingomonas psychrotolerans TaxID=1327635 RepID=A0ABU3N6D0_9SPHN|nr:YciI family protein [Sphingomonas psychrotolerans]MDT8760093.1 YciI family protein [Sphingomonas psychrotolerans]
MIVVLLSYKVELAEIDRLRPAHVEWLKQGLADGKLLVAGRKVPVTGGMFLARGDLEAVKAWAATDPFALEGAADYSFVEIAPSIIAPGLEALAE